MHTNNVNLLQIENDLLRDIDNNEYRVFYQAIISFDTMVVREFEALVRWEYPENGLIPPADFIPLAEETGLIIPIGKLVLEQACRQLKDRSAKYGTDVPLAVSVNLSAKQLMHADVIRLVKDIIAETQISPRSLKLEITESMVIENADLALQILSELCALGVHVSSDDFGMGYSSLGYLHKFPFDRLKTDHSFIPKMDKDDKSEEIVRAIILLSKNLGIEVVAEGIENEQQCKRLSEVGCRFGQGFLFSRPVNQIAAEAILRDGLKYVQESGWTPSAENLTGGATHHLENLQ